MNAWTGMLSSSRLQITVSLPPLIVTTVPCTFPDQFASRGGCVLKTNVRFPDAKACGRAPGHASADNWVISAYGDIYIGAVSIHLSTATGACDCNASRSVSEPSDTASSDPYSRRTKPC